MLKKKALLTTLVAGLVVAGSSTALAAGKNTTKAKKEGQVIGQVVLQSSNGPEHLVALQGVTDMYKPDWGTVAVTATSTATDIIEYIDVISYLYEDGNLLGSNSEVDKYVASVSTSIGPYTAYTFSDYFAKSTHTGMHDGTTGTAYSSDDSVL